MTITMLFGELMLLISESGTVQGCIQKLKNLVSGGVLTDIY